MVKKAASTFVDSKAALMREAFCREYVIDKNGNRAAIAAGFAKTGARQKAWSLLQEPAVQKRIVELTKRLLHKTDITAERVMLELARLAFSDVRGLYDEHGNLKPVHELDDDQAAAIAGLDIETSTSEDGKRSIRTTKVRRTDKTQALQTLARHFKLVGTDMDEAVGAALAVADRMEQARERLKRMRKGGK